jgi:hypothetical protein
MQVIPALDSHGSSTGVYSIQPMAAKQGFELIGKEFGMFKEQIEHSGPLGARIEISSLDPRLLALRHNLPVFVSPKSKVLSSLADRAQFNLFRWKTIRGRPPEFASEQDAGLRHYSASGSSFWSQSGQGMQWPGGVCMEIYGDQLQCRIPRRKKKIPG